MTRRRKTVFITYTRPTFQDIHGNWHRELKSTRVERKTKESLDTWMARVTRIAEAEVEKANSESADGDITDLIVNKD